jgi:hypothetical protein
VKNSPTCVIPQRLSDSPIWSDLLKIREIYLKGRMLKIGNDQFVSFCLDSWLNEVPLCQLYPILYELAFDKKCSVADINGRDWVIQFRIRLQGIIRDQWYELAGKLNEVVLNNEKDDVMWKCNASKIFSVKSVYEHLTKNDCGNSYQSLESKDTC